MIRNRYLFCPLTSYFNRIVYITQSSRKLLFITIWNTKESRLGPKEFLETHVLKIARMHARAHSYRHSRKTVARFNNCIENVDLRITNTAI